MPEATVERWIDRFAARVRLGEFLRRAAEWGAAYLFFFGGAVLVSKLVWPQLWPNVLWLAGGIVPALAGAWWMGRRGGQNRWQSVARLDAALNTGGLLMTLTERPDTDWSDRLPQIEKLWRDALPRIRPKRFAGYLALPLVFAVAACLAPLREASTAAPLRNTVGQQAAEELEELLREIEKEPVLDDEEQEKLKEEVEKLAEETRDTPLTHEKWETVDALRERMKDRVESASMAMSRAGDAAAMLAAALQPGAPELALERTEQLEKELANALRKLMNEKGLANASPALQQRIERLTKSGPLQVPKDASQRQELLDDLREFLDRENDKLSQLRKKCSSCKSGQCPPEGECEGGQGREDKNGNRPGRGGVTRGRGDAELTWGDEAERDGTKFKEIVLPKGFLDQPKDEVAGIQKTAPNEEPAAIGPRGTARSLDPAAGQATWNRKLNPRHRNAVRRYFDSQTAPGK